MKDKTTAGLLALFLGGFGIHRFYLKQTGLGILYLVFCWTYIPAIMGAIDGIIFFTMNENKFNEKYNRQQGVLGYHQSKRESNSIQANIKELELLRDRGVISEEDFQRQIREFM